MGIKEILRRARSRIQPAADVPASEKEIQAAVDGWFTYLEAKKASGYTLSGIFPKLGDLSPQTHDRLTVKFSLVPRVAPELSGLGRLVDARKPHVYVEGIKANGIVVPLADVYAFHKIPFTSDQDNIFPPLAYLEGGKPTNLILTIYSANDLDPFAFWQLTRQETHMDVVIFTDEEKRLGAWTMSLGYEVRRWEEPRRTISWQEVRPSSTREIDIIRKSFQEAIERL